MSGRHWATVVLIVFVVCATPEKVGAAVIVWSAPTTSTADSDVSTAGTLLSAVVAGGTGPVSVNGVTFSPTAGGGNYSLTFDYGFNSFGQPGAPYLALSVGYQNLLTAGLYMTSGNPPGPMTLTFTNLTIGQTYLFQWWVDDSRGGNLDRTTVATAGNSVVLEHNFDNITGGVGQFAIGTFTADDVSQAIVFQGFGNESPYFGSTQVNAFELRAIPEPSTHAMLVGLVALTIVMWRGRRRRDKACVPGANENENR